MDSCGVTPEAFPTVLFWGMRGSSSLNCSGLRARVEIKGNALGKSVTTRLWPRRADWPGPSGGWEFAGRLGLGSGRQSPEGQWRLASSQVCLLSDSVCRWRGRHPGYFCHRHLAVLPTPGAKKARVPHSRGSLRGGQILKSSMGSCGRDRHTVRCHRWL